MLKKKSQRVNSTATESQPENRLDRPQHGPASTGLVLLLIAWAMAATACGPAPESPKPEGSSGEWLEFAGSWNAAGSRRTISLGAERRGSILDLTLGPLHLDLLGLVVDLNQVHLTITAERGPGNLLGNLLCAVAGLLDQGGNGNAIQNLLDQINAILARL